MITHVQQPAGSLLCGQCCIAMVAGTTLDRAIAAAGTRTRTSAPVLQRALLQLGWQLLPFVRYTGSGLPLHLADGVRLLRVRGGGQGRGYHWIVRAGLDIHDPRAAATCTVDQYVRYLQRYRMHVTSSAVVQPCR